MLIASTAEVVSVTIVGVAGVAAGVITASLSIRAQRKQRAADHEHDLQVLERQQKATQQQALRNEMLDTAAAASADLTSAYYRLAELSEHRATETLDEIQRTVDSAAAYLGRTSLLFGPKSRTAQAGEGAYHNVRTLLQWKRARVDERTDYDDEAASKKASNAEKWAGERLAEFKNFAYEDAHALTGMRRSNSG
jgi:hypothetical protein